MTHRIYITVEGSDILTSEFVTDDPALVGQTIGVIALDVDQRIDPKRRVPTFDGYPAVIWGKQVQLAPYDLGVAHDRLMRDGEVVA